MPITSAPLASAPAQLRDRTGFRADVEKRSAAQTETAKASHQTYDERHRIERQPDGGVVTHQSLVGTTLKGLGRDAKITHDDATAAADRELSAAGERAAMSPRQKAIADTPEVPTMLPNAGRHRGKP